MTEFPIPSDNKFKGIFEKQPWHFLSIIVFMIIFYYFATLEQVTSGNPLFGISVELLYWTAFFTPIIHQLYVWICWRLQLYNNLIVRLFGLKLGFTLYAFGFGILFIYRFISVFLLAVANQGSIQEFSTIFLLIFLIMLPIVVYAFYSVERFFGMTRAFGIDHFDPETHKLPMVTQGIFKYVDNGMYWFALLALFLPGLFYASLGSLLIAGFNYVFIWVHFYTVEKPDMKKIFG